MGEILKAPENLLHPRDYVAPSMNSAQTQGATNVINKLSEEQIFNNASQGTGIAGPAVFGGPSDKTASQSHANAGSKQSNEYNVSLTDGQHNCWNGGRHEK